MFVKSARNLWIAFRLVCGHFLSVHSATSYHANRAVFAGGFFRDRHRPLTASALAAHQASRGHQEDRRGFDAEDARAKVHDLPTRVGAGRDLFGREAAFGTDGQCQRRRGLRSRGHASRHTKE